MEFPKKSVGYLCFLGVGIYIYIYRMHVHNGDFSKLSNSHESGSPDIRWDRNQFYTPEN